MSGAIEDECENDDQAWNERSHRFKKLKDYMSLIVFLFKFKNLTANETKLRVTFFSSIETVFNKATISICQETAFLKSDTEANPRAHPSRHPKTETKHCTIVRAKGNLYSIRVMKTFSKSVGGTLKRRKLTVQPM